MAHTMTRRGGNGVENSKRQTPEQERKMEIARERRRDRLWGPFGEFGAVPGPSTEQSTSASNEARVRKDAGVRQTGTRFWETMELLFFVRLTKASNAVEDDDERAVQIR